MRWVTTSLAARARKKKREKENGRLSRPFSFGLARQVTTSRQVSLLFFALELANEEILRHAKKIGFGDDAD